MGCRAGVRTMNGAHARRASAGAAGTVAGAGAAHGYTAHLRVCPVDHFNKLAAFEHEEEISTALQ